MRKSELEQQLREADFRISKLTERMEKLKDSSVHKFQEVHQGIEERKSELVNYMDGIQDFSSRQKKNFTIPSFAGYCFLAKNSMHLKRLDVFKFKPFNTALVKFQIYSFIVRII